MPKMSEMELLATTEAAVQDAAIFNGEFSKENEQYLREYLGRPYGDEVEDQSKAVSTDVADVVESDMPSLARIFLGSGDIIQFEPNTENEKEVQEAEDKTKYVNWIIRNQPDSFKTIHNWMKDAEIQKNGVVKYFIDDSKQVETVKYSNVSPEELAGIVESLQGPGIEKVDILEQDETEEGGFNLSFRVTRNPKKVCIIGVPSESFLITKSAASKEDAVLVGDRIRKTRGELLADGFDREIINQLASIGDENEQRTTLKSIRDRDQGGDSTNSTDIHDWSGQTVEVEDLYIKIDYDGDGIAERRHIMKSSNHILINEPFDHVPYASLSAILMPHKAIGRSRAEITSATQRQKTTLIRGMFNNIYMHNNPRNVVHGDVDLDDMLANRINGLVRMDEDSNVLPRDAVFPMITPYIGAEVLQVLQYVDQAKAQTTGALLANQGLDSDAIGRETATRFTGVEEAGEAKIELIARNYAETGFRDLYEGIAWLVSRFQDTATEFRVLGKAMVVNPSSWKYRHHVTSSVGLGAGNNEKLVGSLQGIYAIQQQLKATQSPLVDNVDLYSTLKRIVDGLGLPRVDEFFNNPEEPDDLLKAENEMLNNLVLQLQEAVQASGNPLAEAEAIKREGDIAIAQGKLALDSAKLAEQQRQFDIKAGQDANQHRTDTVVKLTELELDSGQDVPQSLV